MHRSRVIVILGVLIGLLPFFGFPRAWEAFFQVIGGFSIVAFSTWSTIDKKLSQKAKAQLRQRRRSTDLPLLEEENSVYGRRSSDIYPKTGQVGRRASDISPTSSEEEPLN